MKRIIASLLPYSTNLSCTRLWDSFFNDLHNTAQWDVSIILLRDKLYARNPITILYSKDVNDELTLNLDSDSVKCFLRSSPLIKSDVKLFKYDKVLKEFIKKFLNSMGHESKFLVLWIAYDIEKVYEVLVKSIHKCLANKKPLLIALANLGYYSDYCEVKNVINSLLKMIERLELDSNYEGIDKVVPFLDIQVVKALIKYLSSLGKAVKIIAKDYIIEKLCLKKCLYVGYAYLLFSI